MRFVFICPWGSNLKTVVVSLKLSFLVKLEASHSPGPRAEAKAEVPRVTNANFLPSFNEYG